MIYMAVLLVIKIFRILLYVLIKEIYAYNFNNLNVKLIKIYFNIVKD